MKLYGITVTNMHDLHSYAVRADTPAGALQRLLAEGAVVHFQHVDVVVLDESLADVPVPEEAEVTL